MNIGQSILGGYDKNLTDTNVHLENAGHAGKAEQVSSQTDITGLKEGSVFKGEILDIAGDKVTIALSDSAKLPARLQGDVALTVGDILLFSVKENNNSQIMIKPLFDSLYSAQTQTLEKVLDQAGLSPTEKNFSAAKELMEAGMPVDKGSIVKILSQSMKFEGTSMQTLVSLNKMNVPVTEGNIAQYERYQNYSHQLTADIANTAESMADFAKAFPEGTQGNTLVSVANRILDIILANTEPHSEMPATNTDSAMKEEAVASNAQNTVSETADGMNIKEQPSTMNPDRTNVIKEGLIRESTAEPALQGQMPGENTATAAKGAESVKGPEFHGEQVVKEAVQETKDHVKLVAENPSPEQNTVSKSFLRSVEHTLQKAGLPEEQIKHVLQNNNSPEEVLKQMTQALNHLNGTESAIRTILESPEYKKLLSDVVKNSWSIDPKSMKDPKEIDDLYDKIVKHSRAFEDAVSKGGGDTRQFQQSSQNMRQNMQFMEDINQQMIYAQMPLKLSSQKVNSELYVYADKRKLMEKKDGISVMLHLDMDHLGMTDIKVTLTGSHVNARFYLNDQESFDIMANNMTELEKQLADRGFSFTNEVIKREPQQSVNQVVDEIIDENAERSIKRYTFDARM